MISKILPIARILIGLVLLASGLEKTISPYQNFLYVIQSYQLLPSQTETFMAIVLPWIELFVGLFMVLGLWVRYALAGTLLLFAMFIAVVAQALLRGLPIDQCGCFGELLHIPPRVIILFDSAVLLVTYVMLRCIAQTSTLSLDQSLRK